MRSATIAFLFAAAAAPAPAPAAAQVAAPPMPEVDWEQRLGESVPSGALLRDEQGRPLRFEELLDGRPIVLALVYYECPMLCNLILDGLVRGLRPLEFDAGDEFDVVAISIDPGERSELAAAKRRAYLEAYGRGPGGWRFLVGEEQEVRSIADAVGFRYRYVPANDEYAHPAGVAVLTAGGELSRVLFGVELAPRDLKLALLDAADGGIGSPIDAFIMRCFHYDPSEGRYGFAIMTAIRLAGVATVLLLGGVVGLMIVRERRRTAPV